VKERTLMNTPTFLTITEQRDRLRDALRELVLAEDILLEGDLPALVKAHLCAVFRTNDARAALTECARGTAPLVVDIEVRGGCVNVATGPAGVEVRIVDHDNDCNGGAR
jgi:hypothetical protein